MGPSSGDRGRTDTQTGQHVGTEAGTEEVLLRAQGPQDAGWGLEQEAATLGASGEPGPDHTSRLDLEPPALRWYICF